MIHLEESYKGIVIIFIKVLLLFTAIFRIINIVNGCGTIRDTKISCCNMWDDCVRNSTNTGTINMKFILIATLFN